MFELLFSFVIMLDYFPDAFLTAIRTQNIIFFDPVAMTFNYIVHFKRSSVTEKHMSSIPFFKWQTIEYKFKVTISTWVRAYHLNIFLIMTKRSPLFQSFFSGVNYPLIWPWTRLIDISSKSWQIRFPLFRATTLTRVWLITLLEEVRTGKNQVFSSPERDKRIIILHFVYVTKIDSVQLN